MTTATSTKTAATKAAPRKAAKPRAAAPATPATRTAASRLDERLSALEAKVAELAGERGADKNPADRIATSMRQLLDGLRGRFDQLRVQTDLGTMDARDNIVNVLGALESAIAEARQQFEVMGGRGKDAADALRTAMAERIDDLRSAVDDAARRMAGDPAHDENAEG